MRATLFLAMLLPGLVQAADAWRPAEHPASLDREISAFTRPRRTLVVAAEVSGRIIALRGEVGDLTTADPVVVLDDTGAKFDRDSAVASLLSATQAELAAIANADQAKAETAFRDRDVQRLVNLGEGASGGQLDNARHAAKAAELGELASQAARKQAAAQLSIATIAQARADRDLARHKVCAPAGWTILRRHVEDGTVISSGQSLLTVGDCRTLTVELMVDEYELAALRSAKTVEIRFRQGGTVAATLARVAAELEAGSRRRRAELDFPGDQAPEAAGGLEVTINLALPDPSRGLLVPLAAVKTGADKPTVKLEDGREITVNILRKRQGFAVIPAGDLPPGAVLAP